ncbi:cell division protein CrgA [Microbacterium hominis]|uniref:Cell division protein CrgA n=1 Tax=Microbacterium hominis TaxID=162426 RepID=A0A134DHH6_9MICO|nr:MULTISPECIES: cell division protein CrgA [Microbacterium]AUG30997.1 septation inhibitor protein [Microbacterium hominis]KXC06010.1 septation inhibitor protein [Microbacterium hominis]QOC26758.1 cell division protein CrgA [Microbacterium hominis]QOC27936.1 cell division protein CrgA [Microbacterium hominis]QRY39622.1 cell division protein CrgA [Microbacterium hominis]
MARSGKEDEQLAEYGEGESAPNPVWFKPIMLGLMILGLLWVIVFYLSNQALPIPGIAGWNLVIGFGIAFIGFLMTTRWR